MYICKVGGIRVNVGDVGVPVSSVGGVERHGHRPDPRVPQISVEPCQYKTVTVEYKTVTVTYKTVTATYKTVTYKTVTVKYKIVTHVAVSSVRCVERHGHCPDPRVPHISVETFVIE